MSYDMQERLSFSRGIRERTDIDTIKKMIHGCESVIKTDEKTDRAGVDYIATLRRGAQILIDAKARDKGAARYWKNGPEFALEIWSVIENNKVGWTLNEGKNTDFIFFTFDPIETSACYLISFQLLRMAFASNLMQWQRKYRCAKQDSGGWTSQCVFVPAVTVEDAILKVSHGVVQTTT